MDAVPSIWEFFVSFPRDLAEASKTVILIIAVITALLVVIWRGSTKMSTRVQWAPLAIYGGAWISQLLADWLSTTFADVSGVLWVLFSLLILTSLIWSVVNAIRVIANK